jgi:hypothetical protein
METMAVEGHRDIEGRYKVQGEKCRRKDRR